MATAPKREDRRIQRTRQLLRQASIEVMREKGFTATSIQEITERANVNRGTFYDHFADKYALVEALMREEFQRLVSILPPVSRWDRRALHLLIRVILEDFRDVQRRCHPIGNIDPLTERVIQEELAALLLTWLNEGREEEARGAISMETIARTMSWAIVGAALQWSLEPTTMPSEQMAHDIMLLLLEGVKHLAPDILPA
jgi:AcrR family transcriptional regulator